MNRSIRIRALSLSALSLVVLLLMGCASTQPQRTYYSLNPLEPVAEPLNLPVRVSRVRIPEYIDNDRIWVRRDNQRMASLPDVRWSESLSPAVTRELRIALGANLSDDRNVPTLLVDIDRLEAQWDENRQRIILHARWQLEGTQRTAPESIQLQRNLYELEADSIAEIMTEMLGEMRALIRTGLTETL